MVRRRVGQVVALSPQQARRGAHSLVVGSCSSAPLRRGQGQENRYARAKRVVFLLFIYFSHTRASRVHTGRETLLTVNKNTRQYVQDSVYAARVRTKTLPPLAATGIVNTGVLGAHKEWFMTDEKTLRYVIETVVQDINDHWKEEAWSALMEQMK